PDAPFALLKHGDGWLGVGFGGRHAVAWRWDGGEPFLPETIALALEQAEAAVPTDVAGRGEAALGVLQLAPELEALLDSGSPSSMPTGAMLSVGGSYLSLDIAV